MSADGNSTCSSSSPFMSTPSLYAPHVTWVGVLLCVLFYVVAVIASVYLGSLFDFHPIHFWALLSQRCERLFSLLFPPQSRSPSLLILPAFVLWLIIYLLPVVPIAMSVQLLSVFSPIAAITACLVGLIVYLLVLGLACVYNDEFRSSRFSRLCFGTALLLFVLYECVMVWATMSADTYTVTGTAALFVMLSMLFTCLLAYRYPPPGAHAQSFPSLLTSAQHHTIHHPTPQAPLSILPFLLDIVLRLRHLDVVVLVLLSYAWLVLHSLLMWWYRENPMGFVMLVISFVLDVYVAVLYNEGYLADPTVLLFVCLACRLALFVSDSMWFVGNCVVYLLISVYVCWCAIFSNLRRAKNIHVRQMVSFLANQAKGLGGEQLNEIDDVPITPPLTLIFALSLFFGLEVLCAFVVVTWSKYSSVARFIPPLTTFNQHSHEQYEFGLATLFLSLVLQALMMYIRRCDNAAFTVQPISDVFSALHVLATHPATTVVVKPAQGSTNGQQLPTPTSTGANAVLANQTLRFKRQHSDKFVSILDEGMTERALAAHIVLWFIALATLAVGSSFAFFNISHSWLGGTVGVFFPLEVLLIHSAYNRLARYRGLLFLPNSQALDGRWGVNYGSIIPLVFAVALVFFHKKVIQPHVPEMPWFPSTMMFWACIVALSWVTWLLWNGSPDPKMLLALTALHVAIMYFWYGDVAQHLDTATVLAVCLMYLCVCSCFLAFVERNTEDQSIRTVVAGLVLFSATCILAEIELVNIAGWGTALSAVIILCLCIGACTAFLTVSWKRTNVVSRADAAWCLILLVLLLAVSFAVTSSTESASNFFLGFTTFCFGCMFCSLIASLSTGVFRFKANETTTDLSWLFVFSKTVIPAFSILRLPLDHVSADTISVMGIISGLAVLWMWGVAAATFQCPVFVGMTASSVAVTLLLFFLAHCTNHNRLQLGGVLLGAGLDNNMLCTKLFEAYRIAERKYVPKMRRRSSAVLSSQGRLDLKMLHVDLMHVEDTTRAYNKLRISAWKRLLWHGCSSYTSIADTKPTLELFQDLWSTQRDLVSRHHKQARFLALFELTFIRRLLDNRRHETERVMQETGQTNFTTTTVPEVLTAATNKKNKKMGRMAKIGRFLKKKTGFHSKSSEGRTSRASTLGPLPHVSVVSERTPQHRRDGSDSSGVLVEGNGMLEVEPGSSEFESPKGVGHVPGVDTLKVTWESLSELRTTLFGPDGQPHAHDIVQGAVGNCWFFSALMCLARTPEKVRRLFVLDECDEKNGHYVCRLYFNGDFKKVSVNSKFPTQRRRDKHECLFAQPVEYEDGSAVIWVCVLEKCYAKLWGSYGALHRGDVANGFFELGLSNHDLVLVERLLIDASGTASSNTDDLEMQYADKTMMQNHALHPTTPGELWERLKHPHVVGCTKSTVRSGLIPLHAYPIIRTLECQGVHLVALLDPLGVTLWEGDYSEDCPLWTTRLRNAVFSMQLPEAAFWIPFVDFVTHFEQVVLCDCLTEGMGWVPQVLPGSCVAVDNVQQIWANSPQFALKAKTQCQVALLLEQPVGRPEQLVELSLRVFESESIRKIRKIRPVPDAWDGFSRLAQIPFTRSQRVCTSVILPANRVCIVVVSAFRSLPRQSPSTSVPFSLHCWAPTAIGFQCISPP